MKILQDVPREPEAAFETLLYRLMSKLESIPSTQALTLDDRVFTLATLRALGHTSQRLVNSGDYEKPIAEALKLHSRSVAEIINALKHILNLFLANSFDQHFLHEDDQTEFDQLEWQRDDKQAVLRLLAEARSTVQMTSELRDKQRRQILFYLQKAESEILREKGALATFLGSIDQAVDCIERNTSKLKPTVGLIQDARTTTTKQVRVHQIEEQEKPKRIEGPKEEE